MPSLNLLDPAGLARVSRMELIARQAVEGFLSGKHPSPFHGSSVEYADHRPYTISDEIKHIDWKLLAKTDKYYIKLFEDQTNLRCTLLLDASASMNFGETGPTKMSKYTYGAHVAAALAYLMLGQNDSIGLALFDSAVRTYMPARSTASHFRRMLETMQQSTPRSDTQLGKVLNQIAGTVPRRGMIVLISDLLDDLKSLTDAFAHFRYRKHEMIVIHLVDPQEMTFPFERLTRFKDPEGAGHVIANPRALRKRYLERMDAFMKNVKAACLERGISYQLAQTDTPYDVMLAAYLEKRNRLR